MKRLLKLRHFRFSESRGDFLTERSLTGYESTAASSQWFLGRANNYFSVDDQAITFNGKNGSAQVSNSREVQGFLILGFSLVQSCSIRWSSSSRAGKPIVSCSCHATCVEVWSDDPGMKRHPANASWVRNFIIECVLGKKAVKLQNYSFGRILRTNFRKNPKKYTRNSYLEQIVLRLFFFNSKYRFSKGGEPPQCTLKYMSGVCKVELLRFLMWGRVK